MFVVTFPAGKRDFRTFKLSSYAMDIQETLSPGINGPYLTADHSSPFSADVKKKLNIPPLPEYAFMACKLYVNGECYVNSRWHLRIKQ